MNINMNTQREYERDFYSWTLHSAQLLREGKFSEVDIENVAEEIESMGKSDKRQLINRFALLISHLLKWQYQPERRGNSWKHTIKNQRLEVTELLKDSPSLKHEIDEQVEYAYEKALNIAIEETGLSEATFPKHCPFSLEKCLDSEFLPNT